MFCLKERTIKKWKKIIENYEDSGLTVVDYCEKTGVNRNTFQHRLKDFKNMESTIREVNIVDEPIRSSSVEVIINGIKIGIDSTVDESFLKRIIKACGNL